MPEDNWKVKENIDAPGGWFFWFYSLIVL